jgi:hypothetical protein
VTGMPKVIKAIREKRQGFIPSRTSTSPNTEGKTCDSFSIFLNQHIFYVASVLRGMLGTVWMINR